jgi:hypothetical protein
VAGADVLAHVSLGDVDLVDDVLFIGQLDVALEEYLDSSSASSTSRSKNILTCPVGNSRRVASSRGSRYWLTWCFAANASTSAGHG